MSFVSNEQQSEELAHLLGWKILHEAVWEEESVERLKALLPSKLAVKLQVLPLRVENSELVECLWVASAQPEDWVGPQLLLRQCELPLRWAYLPEAPLRRAIQELYGVGADTFEDLIEQRQHDDVDSFMQDEINVLDEDDAEASVLKFVNQILREAIAQRATDIHIEPFHEQLRIRYRVDGVLHEVPVPERVKHLQSSVLARIKVMAKLDIAEKRLPQDGRINLSLEDRTIDVRVACIPSIEGESISLRLLGQEKFSVEKLGLNQVLRVQMEELLAKPNGIVLVTGPTGSGKSTTLYTFLSQLNSIHRRIVTIEDPVENKLPGVVQIAVRPEIDLTFASGLRSILRGDPNVIMVGEIRDLETAEIAIRSALTGHLVFSTLHTNDAVGGITRLVEMGIEPFLISSSVRAFIAQRLVRTLCHVCKEVDDTPYEALETLGVTYDPTMTLYRAKPGGCTACRRTGYHGRLGIFEMIQISPALQELINHKASSKEMLKVASQEGYVSMREYGWQKVREGVTSVSEVVRVTSEDSKAH